MRPLERDEIVPLGPYARLRDAYRRAVIEHKATRRLEVGPSVMLLFEDRETLRFQVQEMLWVERISAPAQVQHELDVYGELLPGPGELSATLMVQITEPGRIRAELDRLIGIDEHVVLVLGSSDATERIAARFDPKQLEEERISAVQYIRFRVTPEQVSRLADEGVAAAVEIDHASYCHRAELPPAVRASLVAGLRAAPASLLPAWSPEAPAAAGPIFENAAARVLADPASGGLRVEGRAPLAALDETGWRDLLEALRLASLETIGSAGAARVEGDLAVDAPARWCVVPAPRPAEKR